MAKILFLTDSAADIPKSLREELGIRVMPFPIAMGERELRDGEDFTPQEFYQALAEEPKIPTHAQLTAYQFQQCYEETWESRVHRPDLHIHQFRGQRHLPERRPGPGGVL